MHYREYGAAGREVIMLLHGGGLSWWNYREAAALLSSDYHVVLPVLDGHAGSDADFTSMEDNAARIIKFIDEQHGGQVLFIGGLSLGGQILLEMLAQRRDICRYALVESALVIPSKLTRAMIRPAFGSCHGLIRHRWFSRLQFRALGIRPELYEDYYRDTCAISKQNMIAFLEANADYTVKAAAAETLAEVAVFVGGNENRAMKASAERIHKTLPGSTWRLLPGMQHGAFSINHAADYVRTLRELIGDRCAADK